VTAIRQWAAGTPQDVLHRLGARYHPLRGRYTVPSERTFRRVLAGVDGDAVTRAVTHPSRPGCSRRPRSTGNCCTAPAPRPGRCSSSRRSPTSAGAGKLTQGQPRLDRDGIDLYREHSASKRSHGPPGLRQEISARAVPSPTSAHCRRPRSTATRHHTHQSMGNINAAGRTTWGSSASFNTLRVAACDDTWFPRRPASLPAARDTGGLDSVRTSKDIIHGIVSVDADLAGPQHLNHYARGHWVVENRLHWTRDVTFHEDDSSCGPVPPHEPRPASATCPSTPPASPDAREHRPRPPMQAGAAFISPSRRPQSLDAQVNVEECPSGGRGQDGGPGNDGDALAYRAWSFPRPDGFRQVTVALTPDFSGDLDRRRRVRERGDLRLTRVAGSGEVQWSPRMSALLRCGRIGSWLAHMHWSRPKVRR
jgi:hypothetical protein